MFGLFYYYSHLGPAAAAVVVEVGFATLEASLVEVLCFSRRFSSLHIRIQSINSKFNDWLLRDHLSCNRTFMRTCGGWWFEDKCVSCSRDRWNYPCSNDRLKVLARSVCFIHQGNYANISKLLPSQGHSAFFFKGSQPEYQVGFTANNERKSRSKATRCQLALPLSHHRSCKPQLKTISENVSSQYPYASTWPFSALHQTLHWILSLQLLSPQISSSPWTLPPPERGLQPLGQNHFLETPLKDRPWRLLISQEIHEVLGALTSRRSTYPPSHQALRENLSCQNSCGWSSISFKSISPIYSSALTVHPWSLLAGEAFDHVVKGFQ